MKNNYNTKISNNIDNCEIGSELWCKYYFDGGFCSIFTGKCNVGGRRIFLPSENLRVTYSYYTDLFKQNKKLGDMDKETKKLALFYLERSAYKGDVRSIEEMKKLKIEIPKAEPIYQYTNE